MRNELVTKLRTSLPGLQNDLVFEDIAAPMIEKGILCQAEYRQLLAKATESSRTKLLVELLAGKEDAAFDKFLAVLTTDYSWLVDEIQNPPCCSGAAGDVTDSVPFHPPTYPSDQNTVNSALEKAREAPNSRKRPSRPEPAVPAPSKRPTKQPKPMETEPMAVITNALEQNDANAAAERQKMEDAANNLKLSQGITNEMMSVVKNNHRTSRDWTSLAHALGLSRLVNKIRVKVLCYGEDLDVCVFNLLQEWVGIDPKVATLLKLLQALRAEGFNDVADQLYEKFAT